MKTNAIILAIACTLSLAPTSVIAKESAQKKKHIPVYHTCAKQDSTRHVMACNMYKEARGEGVIGMLAVGFVTINRTQHEKFPISVRGVVYQKSQFSWTLYKKGLKIYNKSEWEQALVVSDFLLTLRKTEYLYRFLDFTKSSMYYHTHQVKPVWRHNLEQTVSIGNHTFYRNKELK